MGTVLSTEFYKDLVVFLMQSKQQIIAISADYGLTSMQALTLLMLDDANAPTMSGLCKRYDCDASNITGIVDGLEQKGLVSRQASAKDRRVKIIHIEPAGKALQIEIFDSLANKSGDAFAVLTDTEKAHFASLIKKLASGHSLH